MTRRELFGVCVAAGAARAQQAAFEPTWQSLEAHYETPEWFRDAKFGIWAHWGPQCQPEEGDWYARNMYNPATGHYKYHVEHYGHPSEFGFKDIIHLWKAENWNPERLLARYKRAGARYFVAMANHHDNFDNWNSKYQSWNSVNLGPRKDLIAGWAKAARAAGLRFGVSVHAARAWSWNEFSQNADTTGPLAGVPYDGKLTKADGKGKWWEGLDPQELYAQNHAVKAPPDMEYVEKFVRRVEDLIDQSHPDLIYFDDTRLPLGGAGLRLAAGFYNANRQWNGGKLSAVLTGKNLKPDERRALTEDYERGASAEIQPYAWQTDTCLGQWHYNKNIFARHGYKTAARVEATLADVVSKNGNLLLSVPVKADGTIDTDEEKIVEELAAWMDVNGEAIFGTRPWTVFGESPSAAAAGGFSERSVVFTSKDIRFTTKGPDTLYALVLAWPEDGMVEIRTPIPRAVGSVRLLGSAEPVKWTRDGGPLGVVLPGPARAGVATLRIELR